MIESYIKLSIAALLPSFVIVLLYWMRKKKLVSNKKCWQQFLCGIIFGILAIIGTEWGIPINGAQVNCRDAAVLSAGLLFGAPAGIIAGLLGGIERWISVAWGIGSFTRVACTVSTILAGFYAAILRKYMFDNKRPGWLLALAIGIVMEVFHVGMVPITNMDNLEQAIIVVVSCSIPMIAANGLSVMLAGMTITLLNRERIIVKKEHARITQTIQRRMIIAVAVVFLVSTAFVFKIQGTIAEKQADFQLALVVEEVAADVQTAYTTEWAQQDVKKRIEGIAKNRHVSGTGFVFVLDRNFGIVGAPDGFQYDMAYRTELETAPPDQLFKMPVGGRVCYCRYCTVEGYYVIAVLPEKEVLMLRNVALYVNTFLEVMIFALLFGMIYVLIKKVVVNQLKKVNTSLNKIAGGNLEEMVDVRSNEEFVSLSDDINFTVDVLKKYIAEASARIDRELEFSRNIQLSALPNRFPAFPKRKDFDIYAMMNPAKEVGGDFYDFYMTGDNTLHFLIADVSGKGIPAAMFMMRAKTELKGLTETDMLLDDVFTRGNQALCEGNDAGMFVTAWQGSLNTKTGLVRFVNAGHNPPLVYHKDGKFEYLRSHAGFVLAGMEGIRYKIQEVQLLPGDCIYLYTDGVTEATNARDVLYGEDRLQKILNSCEFDTMQALCQTVKNDVDSFVKETPQSDDITMVALRYFGTPPVPSRRFENAKLEDLPLITEFVETELQKLGCTNKIIIQYNIAIDEIVSNIVRHGYQNTTGPVTVEVSKRDDTNTIGVRFIDEGIPYNPLIKEDPNVKLSAEERRIGGLGIFIVKKTMDDVKYKYQNDQNILTLIKNCEQ